MRQYDEAHIQAAVFPPKQKYINNFFVFFFLSYTISLRFFCIHTIKRCLIVCYCGFIFFTFPYTYIHIFRMPMFDFFRFWNTNIWFGLLLLKCTFQVISLHCINVPIKDMRNNLLLFLIDHLFDSILFGYSFFSLPFSVRLSVTNHF